MTTPETVDSDREVLRGSPGTVAHPGQRPADPEAGRILLIDDDVEFGELLGEYLQSVGYQTEAVHRGDAGVERALDGGWLAVVLDVMMPGMDGFEVLKAIRASSDVPVLMLTGRGDETDVVVGLEVGADDYLPKTSSMRQLLARLRAVMRRSGGAVRDGGGFEADLVVGELRVCPSTRRCLLGDEMLDLTPVEFEVLAALARARGRVRSRDALLAEIRDREYEVFDRSVDMHISALRRKLGDDAKNPRFIRTYRSAGYMLIDPERE